MVVTSLFIAVILQRNLGARASRVRAKSACSVDRVSPLGAKSPRAKARSANPPPAAADFQQAAGRAAQIVDDPVVFAGLRAGKIGVASA